MSSCCKQPIMSMSTPHVSTALPPCCALAKWPRRMPFRATSAGGAQESKWSRHISLPVRGEPTLRLAQVGGARALVININLERNFRASPNIQRIVAVWPAEVKHLLVGDLLPPCDGGLLLLRELRNNTGRQHRRGLCLDEAPATPPIPNGDLALVGLRPDGDPVFQGILCQRMPSWQCHVVDQVVTSLVLPDPKLDGKVFHAHHTLAPGTHLGCLDAEVAWHAGVKIVALVQGDIAVPPPGVEELTRPRVTEVLATHKCLELRVHLVLHRDVHTTNLGNELRAETQAAAVFLTLLHDPKLHLAVLNEERKAVITLNVPPMYEKLVVRHDT